ncbi:MAG: SprB repeat-containing protein, partial [Bacteroidota bacterium]
MFFSNKLYPKYALFLAAFFYLMSSAGLMADETALNLSVNIAAADVTCTGVSDGILIATPDGGAPPYEYAWSNGGNTATITDLAPGTYTVTITDAVGTTATNSGVINAAAGFEISLVPTFETCTGSNDAKVDIVFDRAGVAPYTYLWSTGATGFQLTDVGEGTYSVTVTDDRGCVASASGVVELSPEGIWVMTSATDADCGAANGTVYVNAMTGVPPFTYLWSNGSTIANPTGLVAGKYYVTVTDVNGCSNVDSATVNLIGSNLQISLVSSFETCAGSSDAKVDVVFDQGGTTPYTYLWSDGSTNFQLTDVGAGTYSVTVTDANGCSAMATHLVELSPEGLWLMATSTDADCGQANGSVYVGAMTGVPPYVYLWSNGDTTANSAGLTAGTYTVTVTDSNGCTNEASATVNTSNPPEAGSIFTNDTLSFCVDDGIDDIVNVTSSGNTGTNFLYVITDSNGNILNTTTNNQFNFEGTGAGVCRIYGLAFEGTVNGATNGQNINNITGCFDLAGPIEVTRTTCPTPCDADAGTLTAVSPECLPIGGSLVIEATSNGNAVVPAGYSTVYVLTTGAGLVIQQTSNTPSFTVDVAGTYTIHTLIYDPNTLDLSTVVLGTTTGFDINALLLQGGGSICAALDVTGAPIVVEDCPDPCVTPILRSVVVIKATCGNNDGKAILTVAGDPNAFEYSWSPNVSNTFEANNIGPGTYSVTITDPKDPTVCNLVEVFTVGTVDGPQVEIVQTTPATCKESNGTATLSPMNFQYDWCNGATGFNVTNLAAGECQVTVTDPATGCISVIEVVIDEVNPLTGTAQVDTKPDCGLSNGSVTILPAGGSNNYSYAWSDGGSGATRNDLASGAYEVTIVDQGPTGCETIVPFVLTDDVPGADVEVEAVVFTTCPNETDATAVFTVTPSAGFSGTPVVTIEDAAGNVYTNGKLGPGIYFIIVRDANNCLAGGASFEVREPSQLDVDVAIIAKSCLENGSISLDISGGTTPYTVTWADLSPATGPEDRTDLLPGNYAFTVTDNNGCAVSVSDLILMDDCSCDQPQIASLLVVEASCGNSDGSATLNMVGDPSAYTYTWTPPVSDDNTAPNVSAGIYTVIIRDRTDEDCAIEETFTIGNSDGPDATATTTDASCGQADGSISLTPAGWTYEWQDGFVGSTRNNLSEGAYFIKVTDPADPDCPNFITVIVNSANTLRATANVDSKPNCNAADGSVSLTASGGSNSYTFLWADGFNQGVRTGLASGVYQVTVTDQVNNGCSTVLTFA